MARRQQLRAELYCQRRTFVGLSADLYDGTIDCADPRVGIFDAEGLRLLRSVAAPYPAIPSARIRRDLEATNVVHQQRQRGGARLSRRRLSAGNCDYDAGHR